MMGDPIAAADPTTGKMRFTLRALPGVVFTRRPVTSDPAEGTMGFVDAGPAEGWKERPIVGTFRAGAWCKPNGRPLAFVPTYWTVMDHRTDEA